MKKVLKSLLLGTVVIAMAVGCQDNPASSNPSTTSSSDISSTSESRPSESPFTSSVISSSSDISSSSSSSSTTSAIPTVTDIALDAQNVKKNYEQGEALDLTGLIVTATYNDGSSKAITDYVASPTNGSVLNTIGIIPVTIVHKTFSKSFNVTVTRVTKKAWTDEEATIMSTHLHGEVLPYNGLEESVVAYDAEEDVVTISGGDASAAVLANYGGLIAAAGYTRVNSTDYVYEKAVNTDVGNRYVRVGFMNREGSFFLQAYDPYYYTFPTDFAEMLASDAFYSNDVPPAYNGADYYETSTSDLAIFCYTESATAEADYSNALSAANWTLGTETYKEHNYAVSPDGKYAVYYKYNTEYKSLDIYFGALYYWNTKVIEDFYNKYNGYVVDIPAFNVEGGEYVFKESDVNEQAYTYGAYEAIHAFMYIYGTTAAVLPGYAATLEENNWEVEEGSNGLYKAYLTIPNQGIARLEFEYEAKYGAIIVTIYYMLDPIPYLVWPAEEVADLLGKYTMDTVPAFTGENKGFVVLNDMFGTAVMVKLEDGGVEAAESDYNDVLLNAGYTFKDDTYHSPHDEIYVEMYPADSKSLTITFRKSGVLSVFPVQFVKDYFDSKDTNRIPTVDTADYYVWLISSERDVSIACVFSSAEDKNAAQEAYTSSLLAAGFTSGGQNVFNSPCADLVIRYSGPSDQLIINFNGTPKSSFISLWPTMQINALMTAEGYTDPLPSYDKVCNDISAGKNYDGSIFVLIETTNKDNVLNQYCTYLRADGFTDDPAEANQFKSPNNQYTVKVSKNSLGVDLKIVSLGGGGGQGEGEFPAEAIYGYFPTANGVLPILEDDNANFEGEYDDYYGSYSVHITFDTEALATAAYDAYIAQLKAANFKEESKWGGYATIYYSPDNSFIVWPMGDYLDDGEIYIDIYPGDTDYFG